MEADLNSSVLEDFQNEASKIVTIQALIRGFLIRKQLLNVRHEYEEIFNSIEKSCKSCTKWPSHYLCKPKIIKQRKERFSAYPSTTTKCHRKDVELQISDKNTSIQSTNTNYEDKGNVITNCRCSKNNVEMAALKTQRAEIQTELESDFGHFSNDNLNNQNEVPTKENIPEEISSAISDLEIHTQENTSLLDESELHSLPVRKFGDAEDEKEELDVIDVNSTENEILEPGKVVKKNVVEDSMFADMTSMWEDSKQFRPAENIDTDDPIKIEAVRNNIAMELLWIQQAIASRKNYLKLKGKV